MSASTTSISNPTVTSLDSNSGSRLGGTVLAITGTGFAAGATVTIGGILATSILVNSSTSITATTTSHALGLVDVVVTNSDTGFGTGTGAGTGGFEYVGALCNDTFTCQVGDIGAGGGTIFYVATTTFTSLGSLCSDSCKYLEFAPSTWHGGAGDPSIYWQESGIGVENISGTTSAIGSGMFDSLLISNQTTLSQPYNVAAKVALSYSGVGASSTGDWYLPSPAEFNELVNSGLASSGNFNVATGSYWTSLQNDLSTACIYGFPGGGAFICTVQKGNAKLVRPFRAFGAAKPAAPAAGSVPILTPVIGEHPGQTIFSMSSSMEYKILSADGSAVKQDWTGISASFATSASPALVAGDLILVRYVANGSIAASSDYIYTVQLADIGEAAPAPTITTLNVAVGNRLGNTTVVITGTDFVVGAQVTFGGVTAAATFNSATQLTVITGIHAIGIVDVVVTNIDAGVGRKVGGFEYVGAQCNDTFTCQVGDFGPGGGTIFSVVPALFDSPGSTCAANCKYLEYAPSGWNGQIADQASNWADAVAQSSNYSATDSSAGQWFLPSVADLGQLAVSGVVASGSFTNFFYWSSQSDGGYVQIKNPITNDLGNVPTHNSNYVRAIRAFHTKPAAPVAGALVVTRPLIDAAPGKVSIATDAGIEYLITDSSANVKQDWTDGGSPAFSTAAPSIITGDLILFRVKAVSGISAGFNATYTVLAGDIGQASPVTISDIRTSTDGTKIYITYDRALNSSKVPNLADYAMAINGIGSINPTQIIVDGSIYMDLVFGTSFLRPDSITLTYTQSSGKEIQGLYANLAGDFVALPVTNDVAVVTISTGSAVINLGALPIQVSITSSYPTPSLKTGAIEADFLFDFGTTQLVFHHLVSDAGIVTFYFVPAVATVSGGVITIKAKKSAFEGTSVVDSNTLTFTAST